MDIEARRQALIAALRNRPTMPDRFRWIVAEARRRPGLPPESRSEARRIPGCLSPLWLDCGYDNGLCRFRCDSESLIVKGVAGLVCDLFDAQPPEAILHALPGVLATPELQRLLTSNRQNALNRVGDAIRAFASDCLSASSATP